MSIAKTSNQTKPRQSSGQRRAADSSEREQAQKVSPVRRNSLIRPDGPKIKKEVHVHF